MKFRIRFAEQIVGLFVLIAIVSLAAILIFMGINQRWFAKDYHFTSRFQSGEGLNRGMAIKLKGFTIGAVDAIKLLDDNTVQIDFHIFDTYYNRVLPNSVLQLNISPIGIGGGGLVFYPGIGNGSPLEEGAFIPSTDFPEGRQRIQNGLVKMTDKEDTVSSVVNRIKPILDSTYATINSLNSTITTIDNTLKGTQQGPLLDVLLQTQQVMVQLNETLQNTTGITANLEKTSEQLADTQGLVQRLLDPKGSIAKLLDDDQQLYGQIQAIIAELEKSAAELSGFAAYVNNQQPNITAILQEGRTTLQEGQDVMQGLKNNPLLRGGISEDYITPSTFRGMRDGDY
ncbi:MAG: MlaD family protein [Spirochaetota bacterium]